jgi:hypothetical protein
MRILAAITAAVGAFGLVVIACQPPQNGNGQQPPAQYPPGQCPPGYQCPPPGNTTGQTAPPPTAPPPTGYPTAPTTAPPPNGTGMNAQGFVPCTSDVICINGKCNTQMSPPVCVFPCKSSEFDCQQGKTCQPSGFCL